MIEISTLTAMKREGRKIVAAVVYDYQMAQIVDRAGVDIVSVGDSVGKNVWGQASELDVTLDQMLLACTAVRRGVARALVSCDLPYGPVQQGNDAAVAAARRLVKEGGADMVKVDAAAEFPDAVRAIVEAGIPVWAQFGVTPHTSGGSAFGGTRPTFASRPGAAEGGPGGTNTVDEFVAQAKLLESAGAAMLDFTHSGPVAGPAVTAAVSIPVIGGLGGGPWLDGRVRLAQTVLGYGEKWVGSKTDTYFNTAQGTIDAFKALVADARAGKQIKG